jgi:uncharacterized protein (DUF4415 family)
MKKEYKLSKMKQVKRSAIEPKDAKVKISKTIRLDGDLVQWLVSESERTGIPYQTLLNSKLRESMNLPDRVRELVREEIGKVSWRSPVNKAGFWSTQIALSTVRKKRWAFFKIPARKHSLKFFKPSGFGREMRQFFEWEFQTSERFKHVATSQTVTWTREKFLVNRFWWIFLALSEPYPVSKDAGKLVLAASRKNGTTGRILLARSEIESFQSRITRDCQIALG